MSGWGGGKFTIGSVMTKIRNRKNIYTYKFHDSWKDSSCFYCGVYAQSKDHIPPLSYPDYFKESHRFIVRSCLLCNSLLSNRPMLTFLSRCDFLFYRYQNRFKKCLSLPIWSEDEINQLSGKLRRTVILGLKKKIYIEKKLLFLKENIIKYQGYE